MPEIAQHRDNRLRRSLLHWPIFAMWLAVTALGLMISPEAILADETQGWSARPSTASAWKRTSVETTAPRTIVTAPQAAQNSPKPATGVNAVFSNSPVVNATTSGWRPHDCENCQSSPGVTIVVRSAAVDSTLDATDDPLQSIVPIADQLPPPAPPIEPLHPEPEHATPLMLPDSQDVMFYEPLEPPFVAYEQEHAHGHASHGSDGECLDCNKKFGPIKRFRFYSKLISGDIGIGQERVAYAPFQIEQAEPYRNNRIQFDSAFGLTSPDRAGYFWAPAGTGPAIPASEIDYFDFRYITESASGPMSITTNIPIRALDYEDTRTAGLGSINIGTKTAIVTGENWYFSSIMRMYLPLGSEKRGTANGLFAMEPGLLARYRFSDRCYFHGQAKWWIPLTGNKAFNGQVLNYGGGLSYILYESDGFAALPTIEIDAWTVTSGMKTLPGGTVTSVGGDTFVNVLPGIRYVFGPAGDLGLFEFGVMGGLSYGNEGWYDQILRAEMRWSF